LGFSPIFDGIGTRTTKNKKGYLKMAKNNIKNPWMIFYYAGISFCIFFTREVIRYEGRLFPDFFFGRDLIDVVALSLISGMITFLFVKWLYKSSEK